MSSQPSSSASSVVVDGDEDEDDEDDDDDVVVVVVVVVVRVTCLAPAGLDCYHGIFPSLACGGVGGVCGGWGPWGPWSCCGNGFHGEIMLALAGRGDGSPLGYL